MTCYSTSKIINVSAFDVVKTFPFAKSIVSVGLLEKWGDWHIQRVEDNAF